MSFITFLLTVISIAIVIFLYIYNGLMIYHCVSRKPRNHKTWFWFLIFLPMFTTLFYWLTVKIGDKRKYY